MSSRLLSAARLPKPPNRFLSRSRAFLPPYAIWRKKRERLSFCGIVGEACRATASASGISAIDCMGRSSSASAANTARSAGLKLRASWLVNHAASRSCCSSGISSCIGRRQSFAWNSWYNRSASRAFVWISARSTASSAVRCSSPKGNISFWAFSSRRWRSFLLTVSSQGILKAIYFPSLTALMRMRT